LSEEWKKWDKGVKPSWFKCQGCKGPESVCWSPDCKINICAKSKNIDHCAQCDNFKCELIIEFKNDEHEHHKEAIKFLEELVKGNE
jgi:hypothetical protein